MILKLKACSNGINSNKFGCNPKNFKFQLDFYPSDKVVYSVTKRMYDCVTPPKTIYLNCHSSYNIYDKIRGKSSRNW